MSNLGRRLKTHRFATIAFSVALLGILAGGVVGLTGPATDYLLGEAQEAVAPKIVSETSAIKVVSAVPSSLGDAAFLAVKLQNVSGKNIKAYTIAGKNTWVTTSYFFGEDSLAAGAITDRLIPISSDVSQGSQIQLRGGEFTVTAVFFADGTGDGVLRYVSALADQYAGIRDQANRILPCLRGLPSTYGQELAVAACEAEALKLPIKMEGRSSDYEGGLENAKREVLSQLSDIKEKTRASHLTEAANRQQKVTRLFERLAESPD